MIAYTKNVVNNMSAFISLIETFIERLRFLRILIISRERERGVQFWACVRCCHIAITHCCAHIVGFRAVTFKQKSHNVVA